VHYAVIRALVATYQVDAINWIVVTHTHTHMYSAVTTLPHHYLITNVGKMTLSNVLTF